ncbi:MAG: FliH/SctL family protein [Terracidiphilus sp.]|jgi:flagellar assembly protein FliH
MPQSAPATRTGATGRIELFEYPGGPDATSLPDWDGWAGGEDAASRASDSPARDAKTTAIEGRLRAEFDQRLAEETRRATDAGREQGRKAEREAQAATLAAAQSAAEKQRAQQAAELIESFTLERDSFLQTVEQEVVKLALAVAARILRREAQMDPLLLTGAVRVALGQLSGSTQVRLRVPPAELDLWTEAIALVPNLAVKPTVTAGEGMRLGDCVIETEMGSVDLGIRAQLGEIERGFFDRPGSSKASASKDESAEREAELSGAGRGSRA